MPSKITFYTQAESKGIFLGSLGAQCLTRYVYTRYLSPALIYKFTDRVILSQTPHIVGKRAPRIRKTFLILSSKRGSFQKIRKTPSPPTHFGINADVWYNLNLFSHSNIYVSIFDQTPKSRANKKRAVYFYFIFSNVT